MPRTHQSARCWGVGGSLRGRRRSEGLEDFGRDDVYILIDCPGQIELYTHLPVMRTVTQVGAAAALAPARTPPPLVP